MDNERCTLFTFFKGSVVAAIAHFLCAISLWFGLVFAIVPVVFFFLEKNIVARKAFVQAVFLCLLLAALSFIPTVVWLIVLAASKGVGVLFIICTVIFALVELMLMFIFFVIEIVSGAKCLRGEPIDIPLVTGFVEKFVAKYENR